MRHNARTSLLRGPLVVVVMFVLALMAFFPLATLRAQAGPAPTASPALRPDTANGEVSAMYVTRQSPVDEPGTWRVPVGRSSRDVRLRREVAVP
jgi:hypothetical protein